MKRSILIYGLGVAAAALALQWLELRYAVRTLSTEIYIALIAVVFTVLGIWVGNRLTGRPAAPFEPFARNTQALEYLGITERELEVLELLAEGHTNQGIATRLFVSPNTVKTHLARLYEKLEVSRRTQAVQKARTLRLIP